MMFLKFSGKRHSGVTLIELIVATFIALIVTTIVYASFSLTRDYWKTIDAKIEVQLNCLQALEKIKEDSAVSNIGSFTVANTGNLKAVSFQTPLDSAGIFQTDSNDGTPLWQQYIIYYWQTSTTDLRRRIVSGPLAVQPLSQGQLQGYCDGTGNIVSFDVLNFSTSILSNRIEFTLANQLAYAGRNNSIQLATRVYQEN